MGLFHKFGSTVTTMYVILLKIDDICHALIRKFKPLKNDFQRSCHSANGFISKFKVPKTDLGKYENNPIWDFFINAFSTMCTLSAQKQVQGRSPWHVPCGGPAAK